MGYIGNRPADSYTSFAVQHFTTSATTTYSLDNPVANENEIALFINNVRQEPGSSYAYTASGTTLTLSAATSASDTMYCVFIGKAVQTVTPASGSVTSDMMSYPLTNFSSTGIDDNATSTAITIDSSERVGIGTTSPSRIFQVSAVDSQLSALSSTSSGSSAIHFGDSDDDNVGQLNYQHSDNTMRVIVNASEVARFTSSGLAIGGTGSANTLDDYEEGTFTPEAAFAAVQPTAGATTGTGFYTKVGDMVTVWGTVENFNVTGASGDLRVRNLPFSARLSTPLGGFQGTAQISNINIHNESYVTAEVPDDLTYVRFPENIDNAARDFINKDNCSHGLSDVYFCVTYKTD